MQEKQNVSSNTVSTTDPEEPCFLLSSDFAVPITTQLMRLFFDTNVYIVGAADRQSDEGLILDWLGFWEKTSSDVEVIISEELLEQISRVAKRLRNKDWAGELIGRIWQNLNVHYVFFDDQAFAILEEKGIIPREDIGVYLTVQAGQTQCFVSANYGLIRSLVEESQEFACLKPADFVKEYIEESQ